MRAKKIEDYSPAEQKKIKLNAILIMLSILCLVIYFFISLFSSDDNTEKDIAKKYSNFDALYESQQFVKSKLKSPSTAEFPYENESTIKKINDSTFTVLSFVDSQNGFGALIRSEYYLKITFFPSRKTYICEDFHLQSQ